MAALDSETKEGGTQEMIQGAIVYTRISSQGQEENTSLHTQADAGINFAKGLGLPVLKVYREIYTGAELYDRPFLSEARESMKLGKCSHLIAYSIDRLSRDPIHLAIFAMEAERAGVELMFVTEPLDNTPEGALIRYVKGYAAQIEREKIRERCIRGKRAIALSGRIHNAGTDLYGYRREDGKRIIHDLEALIVADIFKRVAVDGDSVRAVARYLNRAGSLPPSVGKRVYRDGHTPRWGKSTVTRILREPSYKGEAIAWRWQGRKIGKRQIVSLRPVQDHIRLPEGTVPPIVSPEIWNRAQVNNGGANTRNQVREYLLRGWIRCGCGQAMYSETSKGRKYYRCSSRDKATGWCGAKQIPADFADEFVFETLHEYIRTPRVLEAGLNSTMDKSHIAELKAERVRIEKALEKNVAGLQKIIRRFRTVESESLSKALDLEVKSVETEQAMLRGKLEQVDEQIKRTKRVRLDVGKIAQYRKQIEANLREAGFETRRLMLRAFAGRATVAGDVLRFDMDVSAFVVGESARTLACYIRNAHPVPYSVSTKLAA